jgi:MFS family permease
MEAKDARERSRKGKKIVAVYGAGLMQGLALVTFPAASSVFTSRTAYGLTSAEYGVMFLPQTIMAILAALAGGQIERRWGEKRVFLAGLVANVASMAMLVGSRFALGDRPFGFTLLLIATALMGIGFGLTVPAMNTLASGLFPRRVNVALLALNALLGLGTALAPLLVALSLKLGAWWGLPLAVGILLAALLIWSVPLAREAASAPVTSDARASRFWVFIAFALGYGIVETANGNWAIIYMNDVLKAPGGLASLALTAFWGAATAGRVLFGAIARWVPPRTTFRVLPWVIGLAFIAISLVPASSPPLGVVVFGLAGLGCSALLPLTISLGAADASPARLVAAYQIGYGLAAFGIAPLHARVGIGLRTLFGAHCAIALALAGLAAAAVARGKSPAEPRGQARPAIRPSPSGAR